MLSRQVRAALLYPHLPTFGISGLRLPVGKPLCRVAISNFRRSMAGQAHVKERLPRSEKSHERFREFSLAGKVFAVTGGARGLGLSMAEALVEAGGRGEMFVLFTHNSCAPMTHVNDTQYTVLTGFPNQRKSSTQQRRAQIQILGALCTIGAWT